MAQKIYFPYKFSGSSNTHNLRLVGLLPAGVYQGFKVALDGTISPGVLLTEGGVKIEESGAKLPQYGDNWASTGIPANSDPLNKRKDLIVCHYLWEASEPQPVARFRVIEGTPGQFPDYEELPVDCVLLAKATMAGGGTTYESIEQAGTPEKLYNCSRNSSLNYNVVNSDLAAVKQVFDLNDGSYNTYIIEGGTLADGEEFSFSSPVAKFDASGLYQANELAGEGRTTETVKGVADGLAALIASFNEHLTLVAAAHDASTIGITDAAENFESNNVAGAMGELAVGKVNKAGDTITGDLNVQNINMGSGCVIGSDSGQIVNMHIAPASMAGDGWVYDANSIMTDVVGTCQAPVDVAGPYLSASDDEDKFIDVYFGIQNNNYSRTVTVKLIEANLTTGSVSTLGTWGANTLAAGNYYFGDITISNHTVNPLCNYFLTFYNATDTAGDFGLKILGANVRRRQYCVFKN